MSKKDRALSEEHKKKISDKMKGRTLTQETKDKIRLKLLGNENRKGTSHDEEVRNKIGEGVMDAAKRRRASVRKTDNDAVIQDEAYNIINS